MSLPTASRVVCVVLWSLAGMSVAVGDDIPAKPVDGEIRWMYDYEEGKRAAKESGKPLFVVFRCER